MLTNFVLLSINEINHYTDPAYYDTTAYLGAANFIKHHGGVINFFDLFISGKYIQANQHPLYILFLTPFASMEISFFIIAKIISAILGLILIIVLFFIGKKMYGDLIASVAVFGLLLNGVFLKWTSIVACESLLILFCVLCIYFIKEGFKNNKYWLYAGIFAGLAYLTKGTALLLLPGFVLSAFIIYRLNIFRNKFFWLFFILFTLTASPLLIRNTLVFQNPFYNDNNQIISMGQDKIDSLRYVTFDLKEGTAIWKFEKSETNNEGDIKNESSQKESSLSLVDFGEKFIKDAEVFLDTLNISWSGKLPFKILVRIFTLILFLLFIIGIMREKNKGGRLYFLITMLVFFSSLFIMPIHRYFLPLIPFMWIYIALGIFTILDIAKKNFTLKYSKFNLFTYVTYILILIFIVHAGFILTKKDIKNPLNSVVYNESRLDLLNWLRTNLKKDDLYSMGPNLNWQLEKGTWILPPRTAWADFSKFQSFVKRHNVLYIIIDSKTLNNFTNTHNFAGKLLVNYNDSLNNHFEFDPINGVIEKERVDGWNLIYKDHKKPTDFLVYKLDN